MVNTSTGGPSGTGRPLQVSAKSRDISTGDELDLVGQVSAFGQNPVGQRPMAIPQF